MNFGKAIESQREKNRKKKLASSERVKISEMLIKPAIAKTIFSVYI